jgi:hypothetical protein
MADAEHSVALVSWTDLTICDDQVFRHFYHR